VNGKHALAQGTNPIHSFGCCFCLLPGVAVAVAIIEHRLPSVSTAQLLQKAKLKLTSTTTTINLHTTAAVL